MSYNLRSRTINKNISVPVVVKKKAGTAGKAITEQTESEIRETFKEISNEIATEIIEKINKYSVRRSERIAAKKTAVKKDDIITETETNLFGMKRRY
jgi:hypothetical protein